MIIKNRQFQRREPSLTAKLIIIYCEGGRREPAYFKYFRGISHKIKLEVVAAGQHSNNSPSGLFDQAKNDIFGSETETPIYKPTTEDDVWFVIDTDTWGEKVEELRENCATHQNWKIAQSNPCFEVWLYYHKKDEIPIFDKVHISKPWKEYVNTVVFKDEGGFDSRKHPSLIKNAIINAENNFSMINGEPKIGTTEVYNLAKDIFKLTQFAFEEVTKNQVNNNTEDKQKK
ncbi:MAG: RloB family protein [Leptospirales bacterium]